MTAPAIKSAAVSCDVILIREILNYQTLVPPARGVTRVRNQIVNAAIRGSNALGRQLAVSARAVIFVGRLGIMIRRAEGEMDMSGIGVLIVLAMSFLSELLFATLM
jgi:hypothetical protein